MCTAAEFIQSVILSQFLKVVIKNSSDGVLHSLAAWAIAR